MAVVRVVDERHREVNNPGLNRKESILHSERRHAGETRAPFTVSRASRHGDAALPRWTVWSPRPPMTCARREGDGQSPTHATPLNPEKPGLGKCRPWCPEHGAENRLPETSQCVARNRQACKRCCLCEACEGEMRTATTTRHRSTGSCPRSRRPSMSSRWHVHRASVTATSYVESNWARRQKPGAGSTVVTSSSRSSTTARTSPTSLRLALADLPQHRLRQFRTGGEDVQHVAGGERVALHDEEVRAESRSEPAGHITQPQGADCLRGGHGEAAVGPGRLGALPSGCRDGCGAILAHSRPSACSARC